MNPIGHDTEGLPIYPGESLDADGRVMDMRSHKTHAMEPIRWDFYRWEGIRPASRRARFRCQHCGAFDRTQKARNRCPYADPRSTGSNPDQIT